MRSFLLLLINLFLLTGLSAQRPMEKLDRSVVAQKVSNGVYVNWRITSDEWHNTSYKLYRNGTLIHETGKAGASNFLDAAGTTSSVYTVAAINKGVESALSKPASVLTKNYLEIPMRDIKSLGKTKYYLNDATAADLDGDGQYEIIIKRMNRDWSASNTNFTYFEAYKMDGTFMWAIDVGPNITMDVEINIAAFDFDGDGKAEVFMRSSDGTIFGLDINNQNGTSVGDRDGDGYINYRQAPFNGIGGDGYMNAGPEYLSLIDGMTGKELDWKNFIARGNSSDWGDNYGHRANKFFFGAPYLDGQKPSLFIGRGIYTQTKMRTYDIVNKKLVLRWDFNSEGTNYSWQGNHNYTVADVDGDGKDEIVWGQMCVDDNGQGLYTTGMGHGDAIHVGDFDPYRKGIEVFSCLENAPFYGTLLRDGKTGKTLHHYVTGKDCGRCCAGNITDSFKGAEMWGGGFGYSATDRVQMNNFGVAENYTIYWDGDLTKEILDHSGFATSTGVGYGHITKFNGYGNISTLLNADAYSCNYTKGTPCLQADLLGDWREEAIWWRSDSLALRIYTTPHVTEHRIYTLMHDHQYRQAICWQMCGYNQPPHTSFYLGSDFPTPIPAKSTNGKLVWKGTSSTWDAASANFMNGDDAVGLIAGTSNGIAFANGEQVLFDTRGISKTVNITSNIEPELLMVSGTVDYSIGGSGSLAGTMRLDKLGEGSLTLNGAHTYSGITEIWEGNMWLNGSLPNSPVVVRRHANFGGKAVIGNGLTTEFNAAVYVGGKIIADTTVITGNLKWAEGAKLIFDLSDNSEGEANDFLSLNGTLQISSGAILGINQTQGMLLPGSYLIARVNEITGSLSTVKTEGAIGVATELNYDAETKNLYLVVKGVRAAGIISWTGSTDGKWDLAKTTNWDNNGFDDVFVANDSVIFTGAATQRTLNIVENVTPGYVEFNSPLDYTMDGVAALSGTADLYKKNTGRLTINNRNNYTGKTVVEGGSLIMKYAPNTSSNGSIGENTTNAANFVVKDSAIIQITTANEMTSRGITMGGTAGGLMNVVSGLYWNGVITGTKLTKFGGGTLYIGGNNSTLNEIVLNGGRIKLNSNESVQYGVGRKLTLISGTIETINSIGAYLSSNHSIDVPQGATANYIAGARCDYNGALTGSGVLNWTTDYIRAYINGNWSNFTGRLNISANGANSTYEDKFIVNNSAGFPNATINLASGVIVCYKNGTADNGTTTLKIGMLTGVAGANFYNAGLEVGLNNANGSYGGIISGASSVKKVGSGLWILTGANTYTGTTTVSEGTMTLTGSLGAGSVTVANEAILNLSGTIGGSLIISAGGTANVSGTVSGLLANNGKLTGTGTITGSANLGSNSITMPGNNSIGTLKFSNNVSMGNTSILNMQIVGGSANCDKMAITGTFTCNGILDVAISSGSPVLGASYQLFTASSIIGTFVEVNLPELGNGLEWDATELYSAGIVKVIAGTGINTPIINTGVKQNPTNGLFHVYTDYTANKLNVVVTNLQGKIIYQNSAVDNLQLFEVDLTNQPSGIYLLRLVSDNHSSNFLKLIKQ